MQHALQLISQWLSPAQRVEKTCTKALPVIRNEWDVCLALQEFQLKQLILDDSIVESATRGTIYASALAEFPFYFKSRRSLPIERSRFLRRLFQQLAVWRHFAQGIAPREMSARSSIIAEPIFLYSDFGHGRSTVAAIFMRLTWLPRTCMTDCGWRSAQSQYARCLMSTTRLAVVAQKWIRKTFFTPIRRSWGEFAFGESCQRAGKFTRRCRRLCGVI